MRLIFSLIFIFLFPCCITAQSLQGTVADSSSLEPLAGALLYNLSSGTQTSSRANGTFTIDAISGDVIQVLLVGYRSRQIIVARTDQPIELRLRARAVTMDTVEIRPGLSPYQEDSLERREIYGKKIDQKPERFRFTSHNGKGSFNAPVSSLFQKRTRKYKRLKAFQDRFRKNEQQMFIDSRYTPGLTATLTGLSGDSLSLFMNRYPMTYDFARTASDAELMMWIRFRFKEWLGKEEAEQPEPATE